MSAFCVISRDVPTDIRDNLEKTFDDVILLPPDDTIAEPVSCHPDMIFAVLDGHLFLHESYYSANRDVVSKIASLGGFTVCTSDSIRTPRYPNDVAFNIALWRDTVICRHDVTCPALLDFAKGRGYRVIPVKQGYAGCSCLVTEDAVLTFDSGIAGVLQRNDIPCVLLEGGGVSLPGYDCGFIGGAGGACDNVIYLFGNADTLPCAEKLYGVGYSVVSLSPSPVVDYGGIKIFETKFRR